MLITSTSAAAGLLSLVAVTTTVSAQSTCFNYGSITSSGSTTCSCPAGFTNASACSLPQCGGSLGDPSSTSVPLTSDSFQYGNVSTCECSAGWTGPACTVCTSDSACKAAFGSSISTSSIAGSALNQTLVCSDSAQAYASSQLSCKVINPTLQALYPLSSVLTIERTVNPSKSPPGASFGGNGSMYAQLWYAGVEQFYCGAQSCVQTFTGNQSICTCSDMQCTCRNGTDFCRKGSSSDLTNTIDTLVNGELTITCSPPSSAGGQGSCTFGQKLLNQLFGGNGLEMTGCTFGECVQQYVIDEATGSGGSGGGSGGGGTKLSAGVIAGLSVLGAALALACILLAWGYAQQRKARAKPYLDDSRGKTSSPSNEDGFELLEGVIVPPTLGGVGGGSSAGEWVRQGAGLEWVNIGYQIKTEHHETLTRNAKAWLKGTSRRRRGHEVDFAEEHEGRLVLDGVTGRLPVGGFCCVLGPSGAGKSTFIDIIAGRRKRGGKVQGKVSFFSDDVGSSIAGGKLAPVEGKHRIGFVDQSDVLSATSTVKETLTFAAELRLGENVPADVKRERVFEVMKQLGLTDVADTVIGSGEQRGISGGEMRRVSIGLELIAAPEILILDEPTSGLDSVSAARVVTLLKALTSHPKTPTTVICSIHQPNSRLYAAFDSVLLLADGKQLYFGPGGSAPADYFAATGRPCPAQYNIADHLLEIAARPHPSLLQKAAVLPVEPRSPSRNTGRQLSRLPSTPFDEEKKFSPLNGVATLNRIDSTNPALPNIPSASSSAVDGELAELGANGVRQSIYGTPGAHQTESRTSKKCATTFLTQLEVLSGREWRNLKRDKTLFFAHVFFACLVGVLAGGLYFKVNLTIAGFQNRIGSMFFLGSLIAFSSLSALFNLVDIRPLFLRERAASFYGPDSWLLSRIIFDIVPIRIVPTIITSTIVYFMVGLAKDAQRFFKFELILIEFALVMTLFNLMLACVVRNGGVAILFSSLYNLYLMTYAGFFVNLEQIPPVLRWLRWLAPMGYALEALSVNEVSSGLPIKDTLAGVPVDVSASLIMETLFGFNPGNYYRDVLVLFAFIVGWAMLLVVAVHFRLQESR